ncbi:hypothetical protein [Bradyrhizobium sp. DASA03120]|uniref:hypothetical protein n=1 Tax=Bradyrhizobium sp. SMVTL-02 TaxID=3395917 RepID=UPI003F6FCCCB
MFDTVGHHRELARTRQGLAAGQSLSFTTLAPTTLVPSISRTIRHVVALAFSRPGADVAGVGLPAPGVESARVAPNLDAVLRGGQDELRPLWLPSFVEEIVDQPQASEIRAFSGSRGVDRAAVAGFAMLAPGVRWLGQRLDGHQLAAERAVAAGAFDGGRHAVIPDSVSTSSLRAQRSIQNLSAAELRIASLRSQ